MSNQSLVHKNAAWAATAYPEANPTIAKSAASGRRRSVIQTPRKQTTKVRTMLTQRGDLLNQLP